MQIHELAAALAAIILTTGLVVLVITRGSAPSELTGPLGLALGYLFRGRVNGFNSHRSAP